MTTVSVEVDVQDLVNGISNSHNAEQAMQIIKGIDLGVADVGFTEDVITMLVESLKSDSTVEELNHFLRKLAV